MGFPLRFRKKREKPGQAVKINYHYDFLVRNRVVLVINPTDCGLLLFLKAIKVSFQKILKTKSMERMDIFLEEAM